MEKIYKNILLCGKCKKFTARSELFYCGYCVLCYKKWVIFKKENLKILHEKFINEN